MVQPGAIWGLKVMQSRSSPSSVYTCTLAKPVSPAAPPVPQSATRYVYDFQHHRDPFQPGSLTVQSLAGNPQHENDEFQTKPNCAKRSSWNQIQFSTTRSDREQLNVFYFRTLALHGAVNVGTSGESWWKVIVNCVKSKKLCEIEKHCERPKKLCETVGVLELRFFLFLTISLKILCGSEKQLDLARQDLTRMEAETESSVVCPWARCRNNSPETLVVIPILK